MCGVSEATSYLLRDEECSRLRDGGLVLAAGRQQRQQPPRSLHDAAAVVAQLLEKEATGTKIHSTD